jgi:hypothetical protein
MKKLALSVVVVALLGCFGCNTDGKNPKSNIPNGMELSVEPGEHWRGKMKIFIFFINKTPQMAAWIENNQGDYISTITVTNKSAKNNWMSASKEGRPEALPVWNYKIQNNTAQIDIVSAATSKGAVDVQINNDLLTNGQEYDVYLEINHSFDYNDTWPEKENDVNGQPSLIYHAKFIAGTSGRIKLNPIGHGSADGSDGNIVNGLAGMTTASTIIKDAYIIIR